MYKILKFDKGRNSLKYLIKLYNIEIMHIPYYLCDVIRHALFEVNCKPVFYHIDDNFYPICEFSKEDFILYPNYWGVCRKNVIKLAEKYPKLIVDNAHAYYDNPLGFASFSAGHKFGYKDSLLFLQNAIQTYISDWYDHTKLQERKKKFLALYDKYNNTNLLNVDKESIPLVYPYLAETIQEADSLVSNLQKNGLIIYRYWNNLPESFNEYKFYSRLVPIPI